MIALRCSRLRCHRPDWMGRSACVHDVSLDFEEAALHGITGPPGSGKALLLHLLGLLDDPDFGEIELFGQQVSPAPEALRQEIRNSVFGYVFASPCLLPAFTLAENVAMPFFRISRTDEAAAQERVSELLERFDIDHLANEPAASVDPASQYLAALARALVHRPRILLLVAPGHPAVLAPQVRAIVNELHITSLWCGPEDSWIASCDRAIRLEYGSVAANLPSLG